MCLVLIVVGLRCTSGISFCIEPSRWPFCEEPSADLIISWLMKSENPLPERIGCVLES